MASAVSILASMRVHCCKALYNYFMAIYTKRGDKGKTCLYCKDGTERVLKDSLRINALGAIDEVNSYLGVIVSLSKDHKLTNVIKEIQKNLMMISSILAGSRLYFSPASTHKLEKLMDKIEDKLPTLKNFILPGGTKIASHLNFTRSLVRRAETIVVGLSKKEDVNPKILAYLNRLSDALFLLAREENYKEGVGEELWLVKKK